MPMVQAGVEKHAGRSACDTYGLEAGGLSYDSSSSPQPSTCTLLADRTMQVHVREQGRE